MMINAIIVRVFQILAFMATSTTAFVGVPLPSRPAVQTYGRTLTHIRAQRKLVTDLRSGSTTYDRCDVAIMGGGFGGLYTALAISREAKKNGKTVDIALVDQSDRFVFLPLLYDLTIGTASEGEVCPTYEVLLEGTGVRLIKASFDGFSNNADDKPLSEAVLTSVNEPMYGRENSNKIVTNLSFRASVVAVGSSPQSILASVAGAEEFAQPFYTRDDAYATRELLFQMEQKIRQGEIPNIAIVGGGFGGVELAACVARRLPEARVTLVSNRAPMAGTRAEPLVKQALEKLGVRCEKDSIEEIQKIGNNQFTIRRSSLGESDTDSDLEADAEDDDQFDAILWTAGSQPAYPVLGDLGGGLAFSPSGRLRVDKTLRCSFNEDESFAKSSSSKTMPPVWALGDCSEIVPAVEPLIPKTAQTAMQQADVVASNVLSELFNREGSVTFEFQDLGSMLSLGGPNAAILGPKEDSEIANLLIPLLDTARIGLGVADTLFAEIVKSPQVDKSGDLALVESLGLTSLGGYGLGIDPEMTPGTLSGTLSGAGRRAIYALRMPTNKQRAYAGVSAFLSSAAALAKEASDQIERKSS